jgi:hypothetical protein
MKILHNQSATAHFKSRTNIINPMKQILTTCKFIAAIALVVLAAGCASNNLLDKENAAMGAGFKIITPTKPDQMALLQKLPPDKVTPIVYGGKPYFVLPDLANNRAYIGGPKQYQVYQQFRQKQKMNAENYEARPDSVQVVEVNSMNWGEWGGWGPDSTLGEPGWY